LSQHQKSQSQNPTLIKLLGFAVFSVEFTESRGDDTFTKSYLKRVCRSIQKSKPCPTPAYLCIYYWRTLLQNSL